MSTEFKRIVIASETLAAESADDIIGYVFTSEVTGKRHILGLFSDGVIKLLDFPDFEKTVKQVRNNHA